MVNVGIFWAIDRKILFSIQEKSTKELSDRAKTTKKLDSDFQHYKEWGRVSGGKYPDADFATYPRGRAMFDLDEKSHLIYLDTCINQKEIERIAEIFAIIKYKTAYDDHYRCDSCMTDEDF